MSFKAIETQEEFDRIISERLSRQKETYEKQLADYEQIKTAKADLEKQVGTLQSTIEQSKAGQDDYTKQISELNSKLAGYETASLRTRIALQNGLPFDLAERLVGDDEESIKADAERLSSLVGQQRTSYQQRDPERGVKDSKSQAWSQLARDLSKEGE